MSRKKTRLELTWIGKEERPKLEPRILLEDPEKSYHASVRRPGDIFDNMLIHGDNLLALKALEADFAGQVKCIYIDPPYNTGSAFEHYDDGLEHSIWLTFMRDRLERLWRLLRRDGSLWVSIDDREGPYLRVLLDEICGRSSFVAQNVWQKRYSRDNNSAIGDVHEYVVTYAPDPALFKSKRNRIDLDAKSRKPYRNPNDDPKGPWQSISFTGEGFRPNQMYEIIGPDGSVHTPPEGRHWAVLEPEYKRMRDEGRFWFGKNGKGVPRVIRYLSEVEGLVPWTWWPHEDVGHTDEAKKESHSLFGKANSFPTPKPERLIYRILQIATDPGDLVLDSFAGSGTTGAVAQKMGRRWIMVELGDHCLSHVQPRMSRVVSGDEAGGVSEACKWEGGGGFRYYRLAPSLLQKDEYGNWIINKDYNAAMLAEALCKIEGFKYDPSPEVYWQQGRSTETDYIFVTTQTMTADMLQKLSDEVGPDRSLLVMCKAFRSKREWPNLTVKKIPKAVLAKCEWGQDDYSLEIKELPVVEDEPEATDGGTQVEPKTNGAVKKRRRKAAAVASGNLFAGETDDGDQEGD